MAEVSPLRQRMIEDMTIRNLSPGVPKDGIACAIWYLSALPDCGISRFLTTIRTGSERRAPLWPS